MSERWVIMDRVLENIDLTVSQRKEITALLKCYLPHTEVWAYGSRVKFTVKSYSDLDMVAFATKMTAAPTTHYKQMQKPIVFDVFIKKNLAHLGFGEQR